MASNPFDPLPSILRDFSGDGNRADEMAPLAPVQHEFRKKIVGDKMYETRGMLDTRATKRQRKPKEPDAFLVYGVPTNPGAQFGYKSDGSPMAQPAYWGEPGAGEVERGGAVIRLGRNDVSVVKNKTWVTTDATATHQAHPGNRWWEDTRIERQRNRKRLSWWAPVGHFQMLYSTTAEWGATAELGAAPTAWANGPNAPQPQNSTISTLGAPFAQGTVFIDGKKEKQLNRIIIAAALHVDGLGKRHIRFLAAPTTPIWWYNGGDIQALQLCDYSYETDTTTNGQWVTDVHMRPDLWMQPFFNGSGTKFVYRSLDSYCYEVDFSTGTVPTPVEVSSLFACLVRPNEYAAPPLLAPFEGEVAFAGGFKAHSEFAIADAFYSGDNIHVIVSATISSGAQTESAPSDNWFKDTTSAQKTFIFIDDKLVYGSPISSYELHETRIQVRNEPADTMTVTETRKGRSEGVEPRHMPLPETDSFYYRRNILGLSIIGRQLSGNSGLIMAYGTGVAGDNRKYTWSTWECNSSATQTYHMSEGPNKHPLALLVEESPSLGIGGLCVLRVVRSKLGAGESENDRTFSLEMIPVLPLGDDGAALIAPITVMECAGGKGLILCSHFLYDPQNNSTIDTQNPPRLLYRSPSGKWIDFQSRLPGDAYTSMNALIAIDKKEGYYDDDDFI